MYNRLRSKLAAPFLAALPVLGVDTSFGIQAHVATPTGTFGNVDHLDRKVGLGLGFQLPLDFGGGQVLRPKLDYLSFSRDSDGIRYKSDSFIISADYNYYMSQEKEGAYFIAGLGLHSTRVDASRVFDLVSGSSDRSKTGLYYNVGLGYAFNRTFALEVKYLGMDMGQVVYKPAGVDPSFMGNAIVASASFTF